jgi:dihydroorotase
MVKTGSILIKNGRVIDPSQEIDAQADVLILDGKVAELKKGVSKEGVPVLDALGFIVAPGFIDMHVHLREPGFEHKENIETGTRAAAYGGITSVACMPNTNPAIDNSGIVDLIHQRAEEVGSTNVFVIGALTPGMAEKDISNIGELTEAGVVAVSDDGHPIQNNYIMRRCMEYTRMFDIVVISHPEDKNLSADGQMHEGFYSTKFGLKGMPASAEEIIVSRNIILSEQTGTPIHIAHISTVGSVRMVREAKARGLKITAEATPHHFTLTDSCLATYDTNLKMNPPLRSEADVAAIKEGLKDGTIDCIATDHAPHQTSEKEVEFNYAPFGIIGLETAISLSLDSLYHGKVMPLDMLVAKWTVNPAKILRLKNKGSLKKGMDGDVTIFSPDVEVTVDSAKFQSKSRNTPFNGWKFKGAPKTAVVRGAIAWKAEDVPMKP